MDQPGRSVALLPAGAAPANPPPRHVGIIMDGNGRWARKRGRRS